MSHQAPQSMQFSTQEYWSGLPCSPPGDLPNPGIEPRSPELQVDSLPFVTPGKPKNTGVGSLSLLQGDLPQPRSWTGVSCIAGRFFNNWATREALTDCCCDVSHWKVRVGLVDSTEWRSCTSFSTLALSVHSGIHPLLPGLMWRSLRGAWCLTGNTPYGPLRFPRLPALLFLSSSSQKQGCPLLSDWEEATPGVGGGLGCGGPHPRTAFRKYRTPVPCDVSQEAGGSLFSLFYRLCQRKSSSLQTSKGIQSAQCLRGSW